VHIREGVCRVLSQFTPVKCRAAGVIWFTFSARGRRALNANLQEGNRARLGHCPISCSADDNPNHASMILDHIEALVRFVASPVPRFQQRLFIRATQRSTSNEFERRGHSLFRCLPPATPILRRTFRRKIREFPRPQDSVHSGRLPRRGMHSRKRCVSWPSDVLFALVPESEHAKIWQGAFPASSWSPGSPVTSPIRLIGLNTPPLAQRPIERRLPRAATCRAGSARWRAKR